MATQFAIVSWNIFDDLGVSVPYDQFVSLDDSKTLAAILTEVDSLAALVDPITDGASLQGHLTVRFPSTNFKIVPNTGKAVDTTGLFTFNQANTVYKASLDVPAIADAVITNGKIDLTNADVAAYVDWFASAHNGVRGVSKFGNIFSGNIGSIITTRKHRRALTRKSASTA